MFSKLCLRTFSLLFRVIKLVTASPFLVSYPTPYLKPISSIPSLLYYYAGVGVQFLFLGYCFLRWVQGIYMGHITGIADGAIPTFMVGSYFYPLFLSCYTEFYKKELALHFNRVLVMHHKLCKWYFIKNHKINVVELAIIVMLPFVIVQSLFLFVYVMKHPEKLWFLGSFMTEIGVPPIIQFPIRVLEAAMCVPRWLAMGLPWIICALSGFTCEQWIMAMGPTPSKSIMVVKDTLRHPQVIRPVYRTLQMLNNEFNQIFGTLLIPVTLYGGILGACLIGYLCFKGYGIIPMPVFLAYPVLFAFFYIFWFFVAPEAEKLAKHSAIFIVHFKNTSRRNVQQSRFAYSCSPLRIQLGIFERVSEGFTMDYFHIYKQQLTNVLLTY